MTQVLPEATSDYLVEALDGGYVLHVNPASVRDVLPELLADLLGGQMETWIYTHSGLDAHGWDTWHCRPWHHRD